MANALKSQDFGPNGRASAPRSWVHLITSPSASRFLASKEPPRARP